MWNVMTSEDYVLRLGKGGVSEMGMSTLNLFDGEI